MEQPGGLRFWLGMGVAVKVTMRRRWSVVHEKAMSRRRVLCSSGAQCGREGMPRVEGMGSVNLRVMDFCGIIRAVGFGGFGGIAEVDFERRFRDWDSGVGGFGEVEVSCVMRRFREVFDAFDGGISVPLD
jgi:hypothetical protein